MNKKVISIIISCVCAWAIAAVGQSRMDQMMQSRGMSSQRGMSSSKSDSRSSSSASAKKTEVQQVSYAWQVVPPLGLIEAAGMDTLEYNYFQQAIPSMVSYAYACTGNMGAEGKNMLYMQQAPISDFFLIDAQMAWIPTLKKQRFYNTRIPITLLSYNTGGSRNDSQDRLKAIFSGNINKKAQIGANVDYIYSKGSYNYQAAKGFIWGFEGSYIGDRYEFQGFWNHYNLLNKENGGITDDLYIIDPAQLQGGVATINPKSIPTRLTNAHTRVKGGELFLNNRYNIGYWKEETDENDSIINREYVPVTSFIWTLQYHDGKHRFLDTSPSETAKFFEHSYLDPSRTDDFTTYSSITNTVGVSLLEGFNKYSKFGLAAYFKYEIRKYNQTADTLDRSNPEEMGLSPFPDGITSIPGRKKQNLAWVGAQITKQKGSLIKFQATGELGLIGDAIGEVKATGSITASLPLLGDTVPVTGYGSLYNTSAPYLMNEFRSNHFIWQNDFGKERRARFGGILSVPWSGTTIDVSTETLQNAIYFGPDALPLQYDGAVQIFSATLQQNLKVGILHWNNTVTYQTSTNDAVVPLPKLAIYSNLFILCRIATLHLQLGIDCDYYTRYHAPAYQPATATFYNQREMMLGNFPFMTAYANMKLGRCRFYVMMTHVNQGLTSNNYFSSPHYPLNPRRFQMGLSVDFWD